MIEILIFFKAKKLIFITFKLILFSFSTTVQVLVVIVEYCILRVAFTVVLFFIKKTPFYSKCLIMYLFLDFNNSIVFYSVLVIITIILFQK